MPSLGQASRMLRAHEEGGMGGRQEQPLIPSFSCPPDSVLGDRCTSFLRHQAKPSLPGSAHCLEAKSYIKQIKGLSALQPCSFLAARDGGMMLGSPGLRLIARGWQCQIVQQIRQGQPCTVREQGSGLGWTLTYGGLMWPFPLPWPFGLWTGCSASPHPTHHAAVWNTIRCLGSWGKPLW